MLLAKEQQETLIMKHKENLLLSLTQYLQCENSDTSVSNL